MPPIFGIVAEVVIEVIGGRIFEKRLLGSLSIVENNIKNLVSNGKGRIGILVVKRLVNKGFVLRVDYTNAQSVFAYIYLP